VKIKDIYNQMSNSIHIFDLDDSLTETPVFASFLNAEDGQEIDVQKHYPQYFKAAKGAFWDKLSKPVSFKRMGDFVVVINKATGSPFDGGAMDYFTDKRTQRMFEVVNDTIVLKSFPGFHSDPNTIGKKINLPAYEKYKTATNNMILTGRDERLRSQIEKVLAEIGIEYPSYGLKMYSGNEGIKKFKARIITDSIRENGWNEVHFYEDRQDWLHYAEGVVKEQFPDVKFVPHYVSNIKNEMKF
jgi:hypothetical protein